MIRISKSLWLVALCIAATPKPSPPNLVFSNMQISARSLALMQRTVYLSATAIGTNGIESDFSKELPVIVTNNKALNVAWDDPNPAGSVMYYILHAGSQSGSYDHSVSALTQVATITPFLVVPTTNYVAFYNQSSASPNGPWTDFPGGPFLRMTNSGAVSQQYFRIRVNSDIKPQP